MITYSSVLLVTVLAAVLELISARCDWNFHEMDGKFCFMVAVAPKMGYTFDEVRMECAKFDAFPTVYPENRKLAKRMSKFITGLMRRHFPVLLCNTTHQYGSFFLGYKRRNYTIYEPNEAVEYENVFGVTLNIFTDYTDFIDIQHKKFLRSADKSENNDNQCVQQIFNDVQLSEKWIKSACNVQTYYVCMKKSDQLSNYC
ncbi:hypothetical protein Tcan_14629 [Toxocara canis]|uniref:C-type lectin domain-containing protein n=1 Tax=Toxocara canis TaxID=6265 RepID=A0A0B2VE15_TOXCA|nr:hypothetical protein Tcan_14629 [Toxocara canis]